jgi:hypothetical protein
MTDKYTSYYASPDLTEFTGKPKYSAKRIFRIQPEDLRLFFQKKNLKIPPNVGESRMSLNILRKCGYNAGLCQLLVTDKDTGIIGDEKDTARR